VCATLGGSGGLRQHRRTGPLRMSSRAGSGQRLLISAPPLSGPPGVTGQPPSMSSRPRGGGTPGLGRTSSSSHRATSGHVSGSVSRRRRVPPLTARQRLIALTSGGWSTTCVFVSRAG
jgi:hypothetical protein